jgi:hypothetical protein
MIVGVSEMGNLQNYQSQCRKILCLAAKRREKMTYLQLAAALGLKSPRQQWSTVLHPISETEVKQTDADLTLVVVYASGPAKGLPRYFSNVRGGAAPGTTMLDPKDDKQVAKYKHDLEHVFNTYATVNC